MEPEEEASSPETPREEPRVPLERADSDGDGRLDFLEVLNGTDPFRMDEACASSTYSVKPQAQIPRADFIFVVDTSGSMSEELPLLRQGILDYFTPLLTTQALDFTVTVLAAASSLGPDFCLPAGRDDTSCDSDTPGPPVNARFLMYDVFVASSNSLSILLDTFDKPDPWMRAPRGWSARLRRGATPIFVELSDDDSSLSQDDFERGLRALDRDGRLYEDGEQGKRKFVWHSIVGVAPPLRGLFHGPSVPIQPTPCPSAPNAGLVYQQLSRETGGLRIPVCDAVNYAALIERLAAPVVEGAVIPCAFNIPLSETLDARTSTNTLGMQLKLGSRQPELLTRAGSQNQCTDRSFYFERLSSAQYTISLCPALCEVIQSKQDAELWVTAACLESSCARSLTHSSCE